MSCSGDIIAYVEESAHYMFLFVKRTLEEFKELFDETANMPCNNSIVQFTSFSIQSMGHG